MDINPKIASSTREETFSGEDPEKQDQQNSASQKESQPCKKRIHLSNDSGSSAAVPKKIKMLLNDKRSPGLSADINAHTDENSSEVNLSSDSSGGDIDEIRINENGLISYSDQSSSELTSENGDSSGDENEESLTMTGENDPHQNPTTSTQDVLDGTNDPAPKMKIGIIELDISYGTAYFYTSTGKYPKLPLRKYMSILLESEADVLGCDAIIGFRAPFFGGFRDESVLGSRKKFDKFLQDVHSISHLWENGRISVHLYNYSEVASAHLSLYGFCNGLFAQDRSIFKCKILEINWFSDSWPLSVITNVVHHCEQLIFKIKQHNKQKLHHEFLNILYNTALPRHVKISVEVESRYGDLIINGLRERFQSSNAQYFKFKLVSAGIPINILLRNDYGTLKMKKVASHRYDDGRRRDTVIIEQCPYAPKQQQLESNTEANSSEFSQQI